MNLSRLWKRRKKRRYIDPYYCQSTSHKIKRLQRQQRRGSLFRNKHLVLYSHCANVYNQRPIFRNQVFPLTRDSRENFPAKGNGLERGPFCSFRGTFLRKPRTNCKGGVCENNAEVATETDYVPFVLKRESHATPAHVYLALTIMTMNFWNIFGSRKKCFGPLDEDSKFWYSKHLRRLRYQNFVFSIANLKPLSSFSKFIPIRRLAFLFFFGIFRSTPPEYRF